MNSPSVIEINLAAIDHNMRIIRRLVGPLRRICPIVKANAYGLGTARVGRRLEASGADMLAVFAPDEAAQLFASGVALPVLILMPVHEVDRTDLLYRALVRGLLHLTVHGEEHLERIVHLADTFGARIPVHVEVDTGMSRGGSTPDEAARIIGRIVKHRRLELAGIFTHFARAETDPDFTDVQLERLNALLAEQKALIPPTCEIHAANTFALLRSERYYKSMVRIGLAWAGFGSETLGEGDALVAGQALQPCVHWTSRIQHVKQIEAGTPVGYGSRWTAQRPTLLGIVPVGYADGYAMSLASTDQKAQDPRIGVFAPGQHRRRTGPAEHFVPVVGTISMDQLAVDLTDLTDHPDFAGAVPGVGTVVQLVSDARSAPNHLPRVAAAGGMRTHEMLSRLSPRSQIVYHAMTHAMTSDIETMARTQHADASASAAAG